MEEDNQDKTILRQIPQPHPLFKLVEIAQQPRRGPRSWLRGAQIQLGGARSQLGWAQSHLGGAWSQLGVARSQLRFRVSWEGLRVRVAKVDVETGSRNGGRGKKSSLLDTYKWQVRIAEAAEAANNPPLADTPLRAGIV